MFYEKKNSFGKFEKAFYHNSPAILRVRENRQRLNEVEWILMKKGTDWQRGYDVPGLKFSH